MTQNPKDKQAALLAMMDKKISKTPKEEGATQPAIAPAAKEPTKGIAERVSIMLYPEEKALIRQFSAFLTSQGYPANVSAVIRTALSVAQPGEDFIAAYDKVRGRDLRLKEARKKRQPA